MGRASRTKRDRNGHRQARKAQPLKIDDVLQFGPLIVKRSGRHTEITSNWTPTEHDRFKRRVAADRPDLKTAAEAAAHRAAALLREFDPISLIGHVFAENAVTDAETYQETTYKGSEAFIEYAQSLALAIRDPGTRPAPPEAMQEFTAKLVDIFENTRSYYAFEWTEGKRDAVEYEVRYLSILRFLQLRGSSIHEHHRDLLLGLFSEHDDFLRRIIGMATSEIVAAADQIEEQVTNAIRSQVAGWFIGRKLHEDFRQFVSARDPHSGVDLDTLLREFDVQVEPEQKARMRLMFENPFRITPDDRLPVSLLDRLSAAYGENAAFLENTYAPASPLGDSIIYTRPLIKNNEEWFCPNPVLLARKLDRILESWIAEDGNYFRDRFARKRGEFLERRTADLFRALLPGAIVLRNLYYEHREGESSQRFETDAIVVWDRFLFIVESKAGALDIPARRGALQGLKESLKEIVGRGAEQALRTRSFIESADEVSFEDSNREIVLRVKRDDFDRIFLVNVTLESLGFLGSQLPLLKELGVLKTQDWPWSVYLNDLRVISEILETGSDFVAMLKARLRANDIRQFFTADELDIMMMYLREGVDLTEVNLENHDFFLPHGYTDDLDRYYAYLSGSVSTGPKPKSKMPALVRQMAAEIEHMAKPGFSKVSLLLLETDASSMRRISTTLELEVAAVRKSGRNRELVIRSKDRKTTVAFVAANDWSPASIAEAHAEMEPRAYDARTNRWVTIFLTVRSDSLSVHDYVDYTKPWKHDANMERKVASLKTSFIRSYVDGGRRLPARNALCPCKSGRKFKNCCSLLL